MNHNRLAVLFSFCLASILYACSGNIGDSCGGFHTCSTGLACQDGFCVSCGDPGEPCCGHAASCSGDGLCSREGERRQCVTYCGGNGESCCWDSVAWSGLCLSELECDRAAGTCGPQTPTACSGGSTRYRLWRLDANGCALDTATRPFTIEADSQSQAVECLRLTTGHIYEILDEAPGYFEYCIDPRFGSPTEAQFEASESSAASCAQYRCGEGCENTPTRGECP